jgi:hypothetical protein
MLLSEVRVAVARRRAADLLISTATSVVPAKPCRLPTTVRLRRRVSKKLRLQRGHVGCFRPCCVFVVLLLLLSLSEVLFPAHVGCFRLHFYSAVYTHVTSIRPIKSRFLIVLGPLVCPGPTVCPAKFACCRLARVAWNTLEHHGAHIGSRQSMSAQHSPTWVAGGWCTWWHSRCGWPLHRFFCHVQTHVLVLLSTPGTWCGLGWLKCFWC